MPFAVLHSPHQSFPRVTEFAFRKQHRLLTSPQFQAVFANAPYRASHQHLLVLSRANGLDYGRLGLVIGKKNIKKAVDRNRVKRLIRESFRHHQSLLKGLDVIVIARRGLDGLDNPSMTRTLAKQWQRIARKRDKDQAPTPERQ